MDVEELDHQQRLFQPHDSPVRWALSSPFCRSGKQRLGGDPPAGSTPSKRLSWDSLLGQNPCCAHSGPPALVLVAEVGPRAGGPPLCLGCCPGPPVWGQGSAGCSSGLILDLSRGLAWLSFLCLSGLLGLLGGKGLVMSSGLVSQPEELRQGHGEEEHGEEGPSFLCF